MYPARAKPDENAPTAAAFETPPRPVNNEAGGADTSGGAADISATRTTAQFIAIANISTNPFDPASRKKNAIWLMTDAIPRTIA